MIYNKYLCKYHCFISFGVTEKIMDKVKNKKVDVKELKRLKKEKKKLKEKQIIEKLEKSKTLQANLAAKPVPKEN